MTVENGNLTTISQYHNIEGKKEKKIRSRKFLELDLDLDFQITLNFNSY